jgi:hypothetical protein
MEEETGGGSDAAAMTPTAGSGRLEQLMDDCGFTMMVQQSNRAACRRGLLYEECGFRSEV